MLGVFGNVTPRILVKILQFCGEADCLHIKVAGSSETPHIYHTSGLHNTQDGVSHFKEIVQICGLPFIHSCIRVGSRRISETAQTGLGYPKPERF